MSSDRTIFCLTLFRLVQIFVRDGIQFTLENIENSLDEGLLAHQRMYDETKRMLTYMIGRNRLIQVLKKKRSLLHRDATILFEGLNIIAQDAHYFTLSDHEQKDLLAKLAARPWSVKQIELLSRTSNMEEFLINAMRLGLTAQQTLVATAASLEDSGFNPSLLRGPGGSGVAQRTLVATATSLEDSGFSSSFLRGNSGSGVAQQTLVATATSLKDAGFDPGILSKSAGSAKAQRIVVATSNQLEQAGYDAKILSGNSGSAKAQSSLFASIRNLEARGFTKLQVTTLLTGNNGSYKAQQAILKSVMTFNNSGFSREQVVSILRGNKHTSATLISTITEYCVNSKVAGKSCEELTSELVADSPDPRKLIAKEFLAKSR